MGGFSRRNRRKSAPKSNRINVFYLVGRYFVVNVTLDSASNFRARRAGNDTFPRRLVRQGPKYLAKAAWV